jgi:adenylate cyclase
MARSAQAPVIGRFSLDAETGALLDPDRKPVPLRPQSARVLAILAEHAGSLVTKDELMQRVWADTHVTDDSLVQCVAEIRKALGPEAGNLLKTVPKQGYRLEAMPTEGSDMAPTWSRAVKYLAAALSIAGVILLAVVISGLSDTRDPRTIAVMPFDNASGEEGQAYYAIGLSEELIVKLSQIADLRVASRGASAFVGARTSDPRQIAEELKVSYLVEGTVRRTGDTLRITAALIDGESGENLWAHTYVGEEKNVFDLQDSVIEELVRVLSVRLSPQERARLGVRGTTDVTAFDHYLQGIALADFLTAADNLSAEEEFLEALRLDPDYPAAHAQLSLVLSMRSEFGWTDEQSGTFARAMQHAEKAVSLAPDLPFAHFALGRLLSRRFKGDLEGASAAFGRAIELDPNYTDAYAFASIVQIADGRAEEGLRTINEAFARNPAPPYWYFMSLGLGHYVLGQYEAADAALTELLRRNPNFPNAMRILMATYGQTGRVEDAQWLAVEYEALGGRATISNLMNATNIRHAPYRAAIAEGLRLAGLPE